MTLEEYNYPKDIDETKYKKSFVYFIERNPLIKISLGNKEHCIFYYEIKNNNVNYDIWNKLKPKNNNKSLNEMFLEYKKELTKFVTNFDLDKYTNKWIFLKNANVIKLQLIHHYYDDKIIWLNKDEYYDLLFKILEIKDYSNLDVIERSRLLLKTLKNEKVNTKDLNILSKVLYDFCCQEKIYVDIYQKKELIDDIVDILATKKNIILTGAPGVGKTYTAKKIIELFEIKQGNEEIDLLKERIKLVQFHQSYSYEDFIECLSLKNNKFVPTPKIFKKMVEVAEQKKYQNYYLIIDEINRGNVSKIFGELLMCLENDKRNEEYKVNFMYSNQEFFVPNNLYIIGTMNKTDRSLANIDYALRRRFSFFDLKPCFNEKLKSTLKSNIKDEIINTMKFINNKLKEEINLDFCIGHSYFLGKKVNEEEFKKILKYEIIPLLKEYLLEENIYDKFKDSNNKILNQVLDEIKDE